MSYLYRNGNGRNNIVWGGGTATSANYLRRTSSGRNDIQWYIISTSGTYNILERTSSGRNNIRWYNTTFNFKTEMEINVDNFFNYINTATDYFMLRPATNDYFGYYGSYIKYDSYYVFTESSRDSSIRGSGGYGVIGIHAKSSTLGLQLYNQLNQFVNKKLFTKIIPDRFNCEYYNITISGIFDFINSSNKWFGIHMSYENCSNSYFDNNDDFYRSGYGKFYYK